MRSIDFGVPTCFRNALGGMVFAQALCMAEQMFFKYSSSVEGLSDVEGRLISLSLSKCNRVTLNHLIFGQFLSVVGGTLLLQMVTK